MRVNHSKKKLIIQVVLCVVFALLADLILGLLLIKPLQGKPHAYYHHGLKPNYHEDVEWGKLRHLICTNSLGFKDESVRNIPLDTDKHRIIFMGDSFTEGVGFTYEKTFVGLIDKALGRESYEVLNAGVKSYSPKLYYLKTKYLIDELGLKFDELVVYIDISDIQDEVYYEPFVPSLAWSLKTFARELDHRLYTWSYVYYLFGRDARKHFMIMLNAENPLSGFSKKVNGTSAEDDYDNYLLERPQWTSEVEIYERWGARGLQLAIENMERLYALCCKHQIKLSIAVYPWRYQIMKNDINSKQVIAWQSFAQKHAIEFINYFPDFIGNGNAQETIEKYFFPDDCHWNEYGHGLIAEKFLSRKQGLILPNQKTQ